METYVARGIVLVSLFLVALGDQNEELLCKARPGCHLAKCDPSQTVFGGLNKNEYPITCVTSTVRQGEVTRAEYDELKIELLTLKAALDIAKADIADLKRRNLDSTAEKHPCESKPCKNGGVCVRFTKDYVCDCKHGYTGRNCETVIQPCDSKPCLNGGTCVQFSGLFVCNCDPNYTGKTCDSLIRDRCTSLYCQNGGTCVETNSGLRCECKPGFQGVRCETAIQGFEWSTCSRTCGQGTRYRRCRTDDTRKCERRYEDCKLRDCPPVSCATYRYGSASECCTVSGSTACGVPQIPQDRFSDGTISSDGQWPWQVAMRNKKEGTVFCGGTLVSSKWVVTAGHCAEHARLTPTVIEIVAGTSKLDEQNPFSRAQISGIEKMILHPTYKFPVDDVALLKLSRQFKYTSYVQPICFPSGEVVTNDVICYAAGWRAASATPRQSNDLLHVGLRTLPIDACIQGFKNTGFAPSVMEKVLCAGILAGGKDTCIGSGGSPLMCQRKNSCQWYFAGIEAFGPRQCDIGYIPTGFMDVAIYEQWIKEQMNKN